MKSDLKFLRAMKYTLQRQSGDAVGDLAWVANEAALTGEPQGKALNLVSTESLVLKKTQGGLAHRAHPLVFSEQEQGVIGHGTRLSKVAV